MPDEPSGLGEFNFPDVDYEEVSRLIEAKKRKARPYLSHI